MMLKQLVFIVALTGCVLSVLSAPVNDVCFTKRTPSIPNWHIYHTKNKPLTIGHRGNPRKYQENSLEGFKSLRGKADGFEVDVFLTSSGKLVCFHDDNALRLTGVNKNIAAMTDSELNNLQYLKTIQYGSGTFTYTKRRKVIFLDQLLRWARRTDLLVYIEMKPSNPVLTTAAAIANSIATGQKVAAMVKQFNMVDQVVLNGYDILKTHVAKQVDNNFVVGTAYISNFWYVPASVFPVIKGQLAQQFPSIVPCINPIPATSKLLDYIYTSGVVEKAMNAAYLDIQLVMYNNPLFGTSNSLATLKANYSSDIVVGAYTAYSMEKTASAIAAEEATLASMIKEGFHFFVTDDVKKMRKKIRKNKKRGKPCRHHGHGDDTDDDKEHQRNDDHDDEDEAFEDDNEVEEYL